MADNTDTTRPGETEAVDAAARAEYLGYYAGRPDVPWESLDPDLKWQLRNTVKGGVAVVYPVIAAAVREQAAQDIEAAKAAETGRTPVAAGYRLGLEDAADVVRGGR